MGPPRWCHGLELIVGSYEGRKITALFCSQIHHQGILNDTHREYIIFYHFLHSVIGKSCLCIIMLGMIKSTSEISHCDCYGRIWLLGWPSRSDKSFKLITYIVMAFSSALVLTDLNDYISPSQACIKPVEVQKKETEEQVWNVSP